MTNNYGNLELNKKIRESYIVKKRESKTAEFKETKTVSPEAIKTMRETGISKMEYYEKFVHGIITENSVSDEVMIGSLEYYLEDFGEYLKDKKRVLIEKFVDYKKYPNSHLDDLIKYKRKLKWGLKDTFYQIFEHDGLGRKFLNQKKDHDTSLFYTDVVNAGASMALLYYLHKSGFDMISVPILIYLAYITICTFKASYYAGPKSYHYINKYVKGIIKELKK